MVNRDLALTKFQKDILIGYILGDGCLDPSRSSGIASLMVEQSLKQKDFVYWLYEVFKNFTKTPPKEKHLMCSNFKGTFRRDSVYFSTLGFNQFYRIYKMFYPSGKKVIPNDIERFLNPLSLSVWFMADGSVKSKECNGRIFNTHCFTGTDVSKLCQILNKKFFLLTTVRRQKEGMQIYISAKSAVTLTKLVAPHLLPFFNYKLPKFKC